MVITLTPPYMRFRIRRFLFWVPFEENESRRKTTSFSSYSIFLLPLFSLSSLLLSPLTSIQPLYILIYRTDRTQICEA